jgi:DNA-binding SARP family transcriptional activator/RecA/RadA recombinase
MALSVWLLGPPQIRMDRDSVSSLRSDKALALLAYLIVESDRAHRREKLAGMLWPDYAESSARANLRRALADLRLSMGDRHATPPYFHTTRETIQFNADSDYWLDVAAFADLVCDPTSLEQAVALYQGTFLEGFSVSDAPFFEEWALLKKEQLERQFSELLHRLVSTYERRGEYERAQRYAWRRVELEPWDEQAHRQLMQLLALTGQRNAALAQYETCRSLLARDLGAEPDQKTTTLYESIRDGALVAPPFVVPTPTFVSGETQAVVAERPAFVARERELAQLGGFLDQALGGRGRVVLVVGEPGSGKSVLAQEFVRQAMDTHPDLVAVNGRCNAHTGIGDPYLPFLEMVQMLSGDVEARWAAGAITREHARRLWALMPGTLQAIARDGPELIDRFVPGAALLARARAGAPRLVAQLAELLERRAASGNGVANLQQTDLFEQYTRVLKALSRDHPLILVVDDLQWADAGSIGLLFHVGRRVAGSRILLVGAYRPGDVAQGRPLAGAGWERHPLEPVILEFQRDLGEIYIDLDQAEGGKFVEALLDSEPNRLDAAFRETLQRHTGGHPLFTVELLRGLQERGGLTKDESGRWIAGLALDWETLPPRVEAVIAERFGRLPEEWQAMLATASVEGEEFTAEAVARAQVVDERHVLQLLSGPLSQQHHLVHAQGFQWLGEQCLSRYRFRHYLFQKYLYNKLDLVQRAYLHGAMGNVLEMLHGERASELAVPLARHFEAAGMTVRAVDYLLEAGNRAVYLFANDEAIAHYRRGIELVQTLADTQQRVQMELALQVALGVPLLATRGFSDVELAQAYGRARDLTRSLEASPELFQALSGLKGYYDLRLELQVARQLSEDMVQVAQRLNDAGLSAMAHHQQSTTLVYLGRAHDFFEQRARMLALYDPERDRAMVYQFGFDPQVASLSHAAWAHWFLGYPDQARQRSEEALGLARELGHPFVLAFALLFATMVCAYRREVQTARERAEATVAVSSEHGIAFWLAAGMGVMGWVLAEEGRLREGIDQILQGRAMLQVIGAELGHLQLLPLLAAAYRNAETVSEGLAILDKAQALIHATGCRMDEPEVHRLKGELLLMQGGAEAEAADCFQRAIKVAQQQQTRSWELRATTSLCRLWQRQGRQEEARQVLSAIYSWFTEGFDTIDLRDARSLLEELM